MAEVYSSKPPTYVRVLELLVIVLIGGLTAYCSTVRIREVVSDEEPLPQETPVVIEEQPRVSSLLPPVDPSVKPPTPPEEPEVVVAPVDADEPEVEAPKPKTVAKPVKEKPAPKPVVKPVPEEPVVQPQPGYQPRNFQPRGFQRRGFNNR